MPNFPLINRVIGHHSGGAYKANKIDKAHYHRIVEGDGTLVMGDHDFAANTGRLREGKYAAHTRNLNSNTAGLAMACMGKAEWSSPYSSKFFPKPEQVDRFILAMAETCRMFSIPVEREFCLTHAEVERTLRVKQRQKWDFDYSIFGNSAAARDPIGLGDELRQGIAISLKNIPKPANIPVIQINVEDDRTMFRRGDRGDTVKLIQRFLGIEADGHFGPITEQAVMRFQRKLELRPDGIVGPYTLSKMLKQQA